MVSKKSQKTYSDEFKRDAVRLLERSRKTKNEETDTLELSETEKLRAELR